MDKAACSELEHDNEIPYIYCCPQERTFMQYAVMSVNAVYPRCLDPSSRDHPHFGAWASFCCYWWTKTLSCPQMCQRVIATYKQCPRHIHIRRSLPVYGCYQVDSVDECLLDKHSSHLLCLVTQLNRLTPDELSVFLIRCLKIYFYSRVI